jgi:hypothetical protein
MRRVLLLLGAAAVALSACKATTSDASGEAPSARSTAAGAADTGSNAVDAAPAPTNAATPPGATPAANATGTPRLAYKYEYGVEAAPDRIRDLVSKEESACAQAGAAACEITGVNVTQAAPDQVTAQVTFKATPAYLAGYETRLAAEAKADGGEIARTNITTDDLSKQIVDPPAAIAAKVAARDRLQQLVQTSRNAQDLQDLEDKLAAAQSDLDATRSELADMGERVATADVTLDFETSGVLAPRSAWSPVGAAMEHVAGILAATLAALIYLLAFFGPWAAIVGGVTWVFRKRLFRPRKPAVGAALHPPSPATEPPSP